MTRGRKGEGFAERDEGTTFFPYLFFFLVAGMNAMLDG